MKSPKLVLASIALCMSLAAFSQTDSAKTRRDATTNRDTAAATQQATSNGSLQSSQSTNNQQAQSTNGQQATAITGTSKSAGQESTPKANFGRYYIPVLGSYQSSQSSGDNKSVTITGDESNPGKIWIEGLTSSKIYALLKAVPGTYKIPVQKQDENSIQEGTVLYDENSKQINICLGCGYKDANPSEALTIVDANATTATDKEVAAKNGKHATHTTAKVKAKTVINFTGTKSADGTANLHQ